MAEMTGMFILKLNDEERRHLVALLGEKSKDDTDALGLDNAVNHSLFVTLSIDADA